MIVLPQEVRGSRAMGCLPVRAANKEWDQPRRKKCAVVNAAESSWKSTLAADMEMQSSKLALLVLGLALV